jgi:Asp-tRNA(Asn)/Glu-tRNA(Gln) amidotransferase A subunit family amidase
MPELYRWAALEAAAAIANRETTSEALVRSCLERIEQREDRVGAWIHLDAEHALAEARARDAAPALSPLHGVPVAVKDVLDTADMPTGYGSSIYDGHRPAADAACIALLRAAGMVVLGKTVTTEFAYRQPGKTRNPVDPEHTPGGSSSGSAAAVADFMVPLAIGTQTAGSVIRPASFCGAVGYKPGYGTINRAGLKILAESLDTIGVFARTVPDAAAFVDILAGRTSTPTTAERPPRVGVCRTPAWSMAEAATHAAIEDAAERLERAGALIDQVDRPFPPTDAADVQEIIQTYEAWRGLSHEREVHGDQLSDAIKERLNQGGECPPERYAAALETAARCRSDIATVFAEFDVLLTPSAPGEAPHGLANTGNPVFNRPWTLLRLPCVSVPGLVGPHGLPVGVQVVGPSSAEAATLAWAAWIDDALR